jgi:hypothetical protein
MSKYDIDEHLKKIHRLTVGPVSAPQVAPDGMHLALSRAMRRAGLGVAPVTGMAAGTGVVDTRRQAPPRLRRAWAVSRLLEE